MYPDRLHHVQEKETIDCQVVAGECVVAQHRMVVSGINFTIKPKQKLKIDTKTKWWKLKGDGARFRETVKEATGEDA